MACHRRKRTHSDRVVRRGVLAGRQQGIQQRRLGSDARRLLVTSGTELDWFGTVDATFADDADVFHNAIGISLPVSGRIGGFVELVSTFPDRGGALHNLLGGVSYLWNNDLQFDLNVGVGLNSRATNFIFGFGVAQRF